MSKKDLLSLGKLVQLHGGDHSFVMFFVLFNICENHRCLIIGPDDSWLELPFIPYVLGCFCLGSLGLEGFKEAYDAERGSVGLNWFLEKNRLISSTDVDKATLLHPHGVIEHDL
jgi:hypothetical protein